ncbi:hypothetical protein HMPREF1544_01011 [Mucor circinelloides 1006PhL]|uniref:Uncharacterized protein n=1 Tax=Mucor circinelloides f. circinelloides (strain 1006PhL) TaxID=1220926 RepID=S2JPB5_MUCC1|nr:hypothetical protein HMPREF1544_01011 [Mucor circinelloides 1006PhL]
MITYGTSTLGKPIVTSEGDENTNPIRITFLILTFILASINLVLVTSYFFKSTKMIQFRFLMKQNSKNAVFILAAYTLHTAIHTFHYIDNIYRPVSYFEPKYLYQKYILSTMEVTFYFNFPLTICGVLFMKNLFKKGFIDYTYLIAYICSSLMTLMHYRIESPSMYSPSVNFSIAGEGVSIMLLICVAFLIRQKPEKKYHKLFIVSFFTILVCALISKNLGVWWMLAYLVLFTVVIVKLTEGYMYETYERLPSTEA